MTFSLIRRWFLSVSQPFWHNAARITDTGNGVYCRVTMWRRTDCERTEMFPRPPRPRPRPRPVAVAASVSFSVNPFCFLQPFRRHCVKGAGAY